MTEEKYGSLCQGGLDFENEKVLNAQIWEVSRLGNAQALADATGPGQPTDDPCLDALPWLQGLVDNGTFDLPDRLDEMRLAHGVARMQALSSFADGAVCLRHQDTADVIQMAMVSGFKDMISSAAGRMAAQAQTQADRKESFSPAQVTMVATVMLCACALDLSADVGRLARACPQAMQEPLVKGNETQNAPWFGAATSMLPILLTPYYAAVQFSSLASMDALLDAGLPLDATLATTHNRLGNKLDVVGCMANMTPCGSLDALNKALAWRNQAPRDAAGEAKKAVDDAALSCHVLEAFAKNNVWLVDRLQSFMDARVFDSNTSFVISEACFNGIPALVKHLEGRIDWEGLVREHGPLVKLIGNTATRQNDSAQEACMALISQAMKEGVPNIFDTYVATGYRHDPLSVQRIEPIHKLINAGFGKVLAKYMQEGFDPETKYEGLPSALEVAQKIGSEKSMAAHVVMRSFVARSQAMALIEEMDLPAPAFAALAP